MKIKIGKRVSLSLLTVAAFLLCVGVFRDNPTWPVFLIATASTTWLHFIWRTTVRNKTIDHPKTRFPPGWIWLYERWAILMLQSDPQARLAKQKESCFTDGWRVQGRRCYGLQRTVTNNHRMSSSCAVTWKNWQCIIIMIWISSALYLLQLGWARLALRVQ